ncbi:MAG: DUF2795 domain-containing protein [Streptosporangiales bacterium]|nr:DUF2795 domain-containing protein [Streptosporangiales bacterium]
MQRGSDRHGQRLDEELKHETEPLERSGVQPHSEEWRQPEAPADDEPEPPGAPGGTYRGATPPGLDPDEVEPRTEMARHLEPSVFPTDRAGVLQSATANNAPDEIVAQLYELPAGVVFRTMQDVWSALGGGQEQRP